MNSGSNATESYIPNTFVKNYDFNEAPNTHWSLSHGFGTKNLICMCFDELGFNVIPNEIKIVDVNTVSINFNAPLKGRLVVIFTI